MSKLTFTERAWSEYLDWQSGDKKILRRINLLLKDIQRSCFDGLGKPEPLTGNYAGYWSRRIDHTHRIVYQIKEDMVEIVQCKGHYND